MTEKVVEFRKKGHRYTTPKGGLVMCGRRVRHWLDVEDRFWMHVSTTPPSHDEYYVVKRGMDRFWVFADGQDKDHSPWPAVIDDWFTRNFGSKAGVKLYVWAMG